MSSFTKKKIRVTIALASGNFGASGSNTLTLDGLRTIVDIQHAGGMMMSTSTLQIFGMLQSDMNALSTLAWRALSVIRNTIRIDAGDDETGMSEIFVGQILNAWADYQGAPEVYFHIEAQAAYFDQINPVPAGSYSGPTDVATIMKTLATTMGLAFENNGVNAQLSDPYLPGTALDQARNVAKAANIDMYIDGSILAITPKGVARAAGIPVVNAGSGLIGYPTFDKIGVAFRCLYQPAIRFGGQVTVESTVTPANGTWRVYSMAHRLESERPNGEWFSTVKCTENGLVPITR